jgi:hypothetical protein
LTQTFFSSVIATNNSSFCLKLTNIFALWKNFKASDKNAQPKETEFGNLKRTLKETFLQKVVCKQNFRFPETF